VDVVSISEVIVVNVVDVFVEVIVCVSEAVNLSGVTVDKVSISEVVAVNVVDAVAEVRVGVSEAVNLDGVCVDVVLILKVGAVNVVDAFTVEYVAVVDDRAPSNVADSISLSISFNWFCINCSAAFFSSSS
jgi:hypothetical protein